MKNKINTKNKIQTFLREYDIREMMANPTPSLADEGQAEELKIWEQMLRKLEQERAEIEATATEKNHELDGPKQ